MLLSHQGSYEEIGHFVWFSVGIYGSAFTTVQGLPWTWKGAEDTSVDHRQRQQNYSAGDDFMNLPSQPQPFGTRNASGSITDSNGENYGTPSRRKVERPDTAASRKQKKRKGLFGWLKK